MEAHMNEYPWERLSNEGIAAYEKFSAYRDMRYNAGKLDIAVKRSVRGLAKKLPKGAGGNHKYLQQLSTRWHWIARAEAYDEHMAELSRLQNEADIIKMREYHAKLGQQLSKRALQRLLSIQDQDISASDIVRMVDTGVKVERLSRGESTEHNHVTADVTQQDSSAPADLTHLTDDELKDLIKILSKINK
jgi:hypothetical protein